MPGRWCGAPARPRPDRRKARRVQLRRFEPDRRGDLGGRYWSAQSRALGARRGAGGRARRLRPVPPARPSWRPRLSRRLLLSQQRRDRRRGRDRRRRRRVAILDIDYHHGNGTQDIFYAPRRHAVRLAPRRPGTIIPSSGAMPTRAAKARAKARPSTCRCRAAPSSRAYLPALDAALERIAAFAPDLLIVSYGADTFAGDPISHFRLETRGLCRIARRIASLGMPTLDRDGRRLCGRRARRERRVVPGGVRMSLLDHLFVLSSSSSPSRSAGWWAYQRFLAAAGARGRAALVREYRITIVWLVGLGAATLQLARRRPRSGRARPGGAARGPCERADLRHRGRRLRRPRAAPARRNVQRQGRRRAASANGQARSLPAQVRRAARLGPHRLALRGPVRGDRLSRLSHLLLPFLAVHGRPSSRRPCCSGSRTSTRASPA